MEEQEKIRLQFERDIQDKSKYLCIYYFIIIVDNFRRHNKRKKIYKKK